MDGKRLKKPHNPVKGDSLSQVSTHFGSLENKRDPLVINLSNLPAADDYDKVVDSFYKDLKSEHPYQYQEAIGEGGMGIVDMVKDKKCLRSIAKKTLNKTKFDKESIIRFTEEAQITAQLEHPNIVPVYEMGLDEKDQLYYTMKMVKGRNLKEILKGIKDGDQKIIEKFPLSNLLEIYMAVCDAMSYACSRKIVHRDLKPDNIMVGDFGEVYLVDWGLAKIISNEALKSTESIPEWIVKEVYNKEDVSTDKLLKELRKVDSLRTKDESLNISFNDVLIGTPQYMSPERISGEADECSEVYALGAILYNILTLELTVSGDNLEEIVTKIFEEDIKNPLEFKNLPHLPGGKVPAGLAAVAMKALSAEPFDRYHTVSQLRNEISAWEDGYITEAEKAGPWLMLWSMIKRHRIETGIALIFFASLIIIYTLFAMKLKEDRLLAEHSEKMALNQKQVVESETTALVSKSLELQDKIDELQRLAPELYDRSNFFIENRNLVRAERAAQDACRLYPEREFYVQLANIQQSRGLFKASVRTYQKALKYSGIEEDIELTTYINTDEKTIRESIRFSKEFTDKKIDSYLDLLKFKELLVKQSRFREAAIVSKKLFIDTTKMKSDILKRLSKTHLDFINRRTLQVGVDGGFTLNLKGKGIKDIGPLAGIPFKSLDLGDNPISDLSPLKGMPLEILKINKTKVRDISAIKGAPLKTFEARDTEVDNLEALSGAPIVDLRLEKSKIKSLKGLTSPFIKYADFSHTYLKSLEGLNFRSLRVLEIDNTQITDLSPLKNSSLKALHMRDTKIEDISPLKKVFLTYLDLQSTPVKDFSALSSTPLEKFYAENTALKDLSFLKGKLLTTFNARKTQITDINVLRGMPITYLNLDLTNVKNLAAVSDMPLESFSYQGCKAATLPKMKNLTEFSNLYLSLSEIKDYSFLENKNFKNLDLAGSAITNLKALENSTFRSLNISRTKVSNLEPLKNKVIDHLSISLCPVKDLSPLSESQINRLDASRIPAKNFEVLKNTNLKELYGHGVEIESLNFINPQTVKKLDLSGSTLSDISALRNSKIETLNLAHTKVRDIDALSSCAELKELDLYRTEVNSINALAGMKIEILILGECNSLKNIKAVRSMNRLTKLLIPRHIENINFLRKREHLRILGYTSGEHNQSASQFWKKYDKENANEQ